MSRHIIRRDFVKACAAAGAALAMGYETLTGQSIKPVRWGFIGVGGRGSGMMDVTLGLDGTDVVAICDINEKNLNKAIEVVYKAKGKKPAGYSSGPTDYKRLLERNDIDAVFIATPVNLHAQMAMDALKAEKNVLSEVSAAVTMDECWGLVHAAESSKAIYMMSENVSYYRQNLIIQNMVKDGLFGDPTYSECGYVHDCKFILFNEDGSLTWRGQLSRDLVGNWYPTHSLGPVCQWMGINRGDRLESLVAFKSKEANLSKYIAQKFGASTEAARTKFSMGDTVTTLIRTARGALIDLRFDIVSARPHPSTTHITLQGTKASFEDRNAQQVIWIEGRSEKYAWEPFEKYAPEYEHALWKKYGEKAKATGHSGADFFVLNEFTEAVRYGRPSPIDVYDAAAWSCITPLSEASIRAGGKTMEIPDFTNGKWKERKS